MIELRVQAGLDAAAALGSIKALAWEHPGAHELAVVVPRAAGAPLRLTLGPVWLFSGSPACMAALGEFGEASVAPG